MSKLISSYQTGFIPGRYVRETCRLIYDFDEENHTPGIRLLVDFEKAFGSISWSFLCGTLIYFDFDESVIYSFKTFYNNITAAVTHNCFMSECCTIERGCS